MRTTARTTVFAALLAGALTLTACGGDDPTVATGGSSTTTAGKAEFNEADVAFVSGMVPHHRQAVQMAEAILAEDPSDPVRTLAEEIKAAQQPEIEQLNGILEAFGEEPSGGGHGAAHGDGSAATEHGGMTSDAEMQALTDASGLEAERTFLTLMIAHHRGAVEAAETEIADGEHEEARDLAAAVRDDQRAEIAEMEQLLTRQ